MNSILKSIFIRDCNVKNTFYSLYVEKLINNDINVILIQSKENQSNSIINSLEEVISVLEKEIYNLDIVNQNDIINFYHLREFNNGNLYFTQIYPDTCMTSKEWINKDFKKHIINIYKELF